MADGKKVELVDTEYPKSLYLGGDRTSTEKVVRGMEEEAAARNDGFKMIDKERDAQSVAAIEEALKPESEPVEAKKPEKKAKK